jgi:hypothetical protein
MESNEERTTEHESHVWRAANPAADPIIDNAKIQLAVSNAGEPNAKAWRDWSAANPSAGSRLRGVEFDRIILDEAMEFPGVAGTSAPAADPLGSYTATLSIVDNRTGIEHVNIAITGNAYIVDEVIKAASEAFQEDSER